MHQGRFHPWAQLRLAAALLVRVEEHGVGLAALAAAPCAEAGVPDAPQVLAQFCVVFAAQPPLLGDAPLVQTDAAPQELPHGALAVLGSVAEPKRPAHRDDLPLEA